MLPPTQVLPPGPNLRLEQARAALSRDGAAAVGAALPLVREAIADPAMDHDLALAVTDTMIGLESERAENSRDDRRYAETIAVLTDLVQRCPGLAGGRTALHSHRAQYLTFQAGRYAEERDRARRRGDVAAAATAERRIDELYLSTAAELRQAIDAAPPQSAAWARESIALGALLGRGADPGEADEGIALIRRALGGHTSLPAEERTTARLDLATALSARARRTGSRGDADEARHLLTEVASAGPEFLAAARSVLAGLPA